MWKSKYGTGQTPPGDLTRQGGECYYETASPQRLAGVIQSYATKQKADITFTTLYCYTVKGIPVTLLKAEVRKPG